MTEASLNSGADVPVWAWLILPIGILLMPFTVKLVAPDHYYLMTGELGVVENLTVLLLLAAIIFGFRALTYHRQYPVFWFRAWLLLLMLGCFYFAGEEISWGQQYARWQTPEYWLRYNDQQETNLHNTSALFDQLPRNILTLGALIGGFIIPAFVRNRRGIWAVDSLKYWLWPTVVCIPAALLANFVGAPEKIVEALGGAMPDIVNVSVGELKECFLATFLMLYLASISVRARHQAIA